jgi:hypothetical protein
VLRRSSRANAVSPLVAPHVGDALWCPDVDQINDRDVAYGCNLLAGSPSGQADLPLSGTAEERPCRVCEEALDL